MHQYDADIRYMLGKKMYLTDTLSGEYWPMKLSGHQQEGIDMLDCVLYSPSTSKNAAVHCKHQWNIRATAANYLRTMSSNNALFALCSRKFTRTIMSVMSYQHRTNLLVVANASLNHDLFASIL